MNINEKIRRIRESKEWSQEQMAEKLNMSLNGYAKIERGETKLYLDKLEQIAQILDIDVVELIQSGEKNICFQIESPLGSVYQGVGESSLLIEIERLKLALSHANEKEELLNKLLEQKDSELNTLKELLSVKSSIINSQ
ncbi:helix-turn-helix transcriptional regulator [Glaesserella parasuis]|uniref:helix-turn-helix domain-containing protein n=1 Tax=Glaesserella parasuis TaxID=738 RepID=UPI00094FDC6A|nr:helix-turn-helix transcriptional regulator [Glaesserella parasuis]MDG6474711.1 helix-turn-helix transcriptional regulator [Glaesserella parasuis]MDO9799944.1 helix-turn-helix transcriptional regulator [Glaesserella parasuis]MDO9851958.1 helix-turn-helix transcriptional regulator [Glaesserella parasuis]MDO9865823.1 helix-turn-helix transcriptional regulator [Glaesserella parasuis]MDO9883187.1 helix-turn-helix transcriptional regulator [Glaesserella parasuis]